MSAPLVSTGDEIAATVTSVTPFGVFVEYRGTPGLVRGMTAAVGDPVTVRVVDYDAELHRLSATAR